MSSLEKAQCSNLALLLDQRVRLAEHASAVVERMESMKSSDLRKSLMAIHSEGQELPGPVKIRLVLRSCLEAMRSDVPSFVPMWCPWGDAVGDEGFGEDTGEFNPLKPRLRALINITADKALKLDMDEDSGSDGEGEDKGEKKAKKQADLDLEWKARKRFLLFLTSCV